MASRLARIDAEILRCRREMEGGFADLTTLVEGSEELLFLMSDRDQGDSFVFGDSDRVQGNSFVYGDLLNRLQNVEYKEYIREPDVLFGICSNFFNWEPGFLRNRNRISETALAKPFVEIHEVAYGDCWRYDECRVEPSEIRTGPRVPGAVIYTNSSLSFRHGYQWKFLFFKSSFTFVILLCKSFLPDDDDKVQLISSLETVYQGREERWRQG